MHETHCSELKDALKHGTAKLVEDPFTSIMGPDHEYSAARLKERDDLRAALAILLDQPAKMFHRHERGKLIREITSRDPDSPLYLSKPRVYAQIRRYCQRGLIDNALITDRHKAGWFRAARSENPPKRKLGADRSGDTPEAKRAGYVFTEESEKTFFPVIEDLFEQPMDNGRHRSWTKVRQECCELLLGQSEVCDGVKSVVMPVDSALPTVDQLQRIYSARKIDIPEALTACGVSS